MPFISIVTVPGYDHFEIVASSDPLTFAQPVGAEGTFDSRAHVVVFQRDVPDPVGVLSKVQTALADNRVRTETSTFACSAPTAIRAVELAVAELWPPTRLYCQDCQHHFVAPIREASKMYLACPHCHNPMLNPRWDSA